MCRPRFDALRVRLAVLLLPFALFGCPPEPVEPQVGLSEEAPPGDPPPAPTEPGPGAGGAGERCVRVPGEPPRVEDYFCPVDCPLDEPSCQRLEVATALVRAEVDQAQRETVYGSEHPDVQAGRRVIAALSERNAELAARDWPLDADALRLRLDRELALERLAMELLAAQRLPHHPDLVARRARLELLQQRLDELAAGSWP